MSGANGLSEQLLPSSVSRRKEGDRGQHLVMGTR